MSTHDWVDSVLFAFTVFFLGVGVGFVTAYMVIRQHTLPHGRIDYEQNVKPSVIQDTTRSLGQTRSRIHPGRVSLHK